MSTAFLGQIMMFGGNFAPRGTAFCNGQLLPIAQNTALFSLLGTFYGGNGQTTFALPDLRSRIPLHQGQGPGLSNRPLGESAGSSSVTLTAQQMPFHSHTFAASAANASAAAIGGSLVPAKPTAAEGALYATQGNPNNLEMYALNSLLTAGSSQPHDNMMPSLCISFVIFLNGIYPSRN